MGKTADFSTFLQGFHLYCIAEGKSPTTIRWYMGKLRCFLQYLRMNDLPTDLQEINANHLRSFIVHLQTEVRADENNPRKPAREEGLSPYTIQGYARTLKAFFSWLEREDYVEDNRTRLLKVPKAPRKIVETFTEGQIYRLLETIDKNMPCGFRDYCIILTFLDTGIRLSELVNLKLDDMDLERAYLKVTGKGWKERIVPIGAKIQKALWKYLHQYRVRPMHPNTKHLFLYKDGTAMTAGRVYRMIARYGRKAVIDGVRCSPHTFRHTFGKNFLLNGGDLFTLQKILGHTSLEVVRLCVNLLTKDVQVQHRKYSPVDFMQIQV